MKQFDREMTAMTSDEKEATMEMMTSWERQGRDEGLQAGRQLGKEEVVALQHERRFSTLPSDFASRLDRLTPEQLNELGLAIFDFDSLADLEEWLARQQMSRVANPPIGRRLVAEQSLPGHRPRRRAVGSPSQPWRFLSS
jgi:hypothetical protein